ncbi:hypothetical protein ACFX2I_003935 [Malus domestica]
MNSQSVKHISECFIIPHHVSEESQQPLYLAPTNLAMLSVHYIQKGFPFEKPLEAMDRCHKAEFVNSLLDKLKHSLSLALIHFYPIAGRFATKKEENPPLLFALNSGSDIDPSKPYAEFWIETHEFRSSYADSGSEPLSLKAWISQDLSVFGDKLFEK